MIKNWIKIKNLDFEVLKSTFYFLCTHDDTKIIFYLFIYIECFIMKILLDQLF